MKRRYKTYFKLNLMSLFFIAISFISVTLAWFAYSGLARVSIDIPVKAWYIELSKDGDSVTNNVIISLDDLYPGMATVNELIKIQNLGDSDAELKYKIVSVNILGDDKSSYYIDDMTITTEYIEDMLSHEFPFNININLSKNYVLAKGDIGYFEVSISWPLDSDRNELDSEWGTKAYNFGKEEERKKGLDPDYQIKPPIQVIISLIADQYLEIETSSDIRYNLGDTILFDVLNKKVCNIVVGSCIETHIIDINNTLGDTTVTLLPNPLSTAYLKGTYSDYDTLLSTITSTWTVDKRPLLVNDLMKIISKDVKNSFLVRDNLSDAIIGSLTYNNRMNIELTKAITYNGYYKFSNEVFNFLPSSECYWTKSEYDIDPESESSNAFALMKIDEDYSKVFSNEKEETCKVVPVIIIDKSDLIIE